MKVVSGSRRFPVAATSFPGGSEGVAKVNDG